MTITHNDFQKFQSSEKLTLCIAEARERIYPEEADTDVYSVELSHLTLTKVEVLGVGYTAVSALTELEYNSFYFDLETKTLSIKSSLDLTIQYTAVTYKFYFSNKPISLPHDLDSGYEVPFEPYLKSTSFFNTELDFVNNELALIEGSGSVTFSNNDFWYDNYDLLYFENQNVNLYSYSSSLPVTEAKLFFTGTVESKGYSGSAITFKLKDMLYSLRTQVETGYIKDLELRNSTNEDLYLQRVIYGRKEGVSLTNVDRVKTGYPLTGNVSLSTTKLLIGEGTKFKTELIAQDKLVINSIEYTVESIVSDYALNLSTASTESYYGKVYVIPKYSKPYINRIWNVAGHALHTPTYTIQTGSTVFRLILDTTKDLYPGDEILIDGTELIEIRKVVNSRMIELQTSTAVSYTAGTTLIRPAIQNLMINNELKLDYVTDFEVDSNSGLITLVNACELEKSTIQTSKEFITVVNGDNFLAGTNTKFTSYIKQGDYVRPEGSIDFYQVLEVTDTLITLTENYTGTTYISQLPVYNQHVINGLSSFKHVYKFTANAALVTAASLQGKYFKIFDSEGSVAIWFDLNNVNTSEPSHDCDRSIEIDTVRIGDTYQTLLFRLKQKLNLDEEFNAEIVNDNELLITSNFIGARCPAVSNSVDFPVVTLNSNEQKVQCLPDVANSLDGNGFYLWDDTGLVFFWYQVSGSATPVPSNDGYRTVLISTVITDDSTATVMTKTKAVVEADSKFTTSAYSADSFKAVSVMPSFNLATVSAVDYMLATETEGKSLYELNGTYFNLPYHYTGTDRTVGVWFDIDNNGTAAPTTGATSDIEVNTLLSEDDEETFFDSLSNALDASGFFSTEYSSAGIIITDLNAETVSTSFDLGTSDIYIEQTLVGAGTNGIDGKPLQYKSFLIKDTDTLSCTVYGKYNDEGDLIKTPQDVVADLLTMAGLGDKIDEATFGLYSEVEVGFCYPESRTNKTTVTYRELINKVNQSVLGVLSQSTDFKFTYDLLNPRASLTLPYFDESDVLDFSIDSTNKNIVETVAVTYAENESTKAVDIAEKTSETSRYLLNTNRSKSIESYLIQEADADRLAARWSFLLENSTNQVTFSTKLQGINLSVNDVILVKHTKFYRRFTDSDVRVLLVEKLGKKGDGVEISCIDLSDAFTRVAKISPNDAGTFNTSIFLSDKGFVSNDNGSIDGSKKAISYLLNKIW